MYSPTNQQTHFFPLTNNNLSHQTSNTNNAYIYPLKEETPNKDSSCVYSQKEEKNEPAQKRSPGRPKKNTKTISKPKKSVNCK